MTDIVDQLDVFWTELSPARAVVYVRLTGEPFHADWKLTGFVRGPRSVRHQTLPETTPLVDLGAGPTHLARAVIAEPSFWSADAPNLYEVSVALACGDDPPRTATRTIGLRSIVAGSRYLVRDGKTWVPRGMLVHSLNEVDLASASELGAVLVADPSDEKLLAQASAQGVYVAAQVQGGAIAEQLRFLTWQPAVFMAVVKGAASIGVAQRNAANLLLVQNLRGDDSLAFADWAQAFWIDVGQVDRLRSVQNLPDRPVFVSRPLTEPTDLANARAACDALQRELTSHGQFAGYFV